ncbi:hypothetical protein AMS68_006981 [Peltaster fructicola]|uniref:Uncharacterized protein n=1 Tax=Peltaster fructicola TaxID=286661 RepID=A0A6H0Y377_9PEZI|nr:hypothetical protein AMS68_006981 [Peltaster fructicola]
MQGFNMGRYVPPESEGTTSGNKLNKKRAPGTLRKDGTQTVRFEMPYAVWCHTCQPHAIIGQGVRFNASKKKIGYYFSTPIWQFELKHVACGGAIVIKTDPKNTAYVVTAGGKARDYGESADRVREGHDGLPILTDEERARRREDAFAELEAKNEEKIQTADNAKRIQDLYRDRQQAWEDPWDSNRKLRNTFRHDRKLRKREDMATQSLKDRIGTDIDMLPTTEEDAEQARLVTFGQLRSKSDSSKGRADSSMLKTSLQRDLIRNTRSTLDPFG